MNIKEIDKPEIKKIVVVYAGRFQPFHKGHYATYQKLVSKFGAGNVYIGTSNDTSGNKSPFNFNEKKIIMNKMFGIPSNKIIQVKNPYAPKEVLSGMNGKTTAYIAAVGQKDADRLQGKYFKPYNGKTGYGYDKIGYVYPVPAEDNAISGTDVRKWLGTGDDKSKQNGFLKAYPTFDKAIFKMITGKLNEDGFPGGIGVGLVLPGGYINGAPTGSQNESNNTQPSTEFRDEPHPTRHEREHPEDEKKAFDGNKAPYDPISEILGRAVAEGIFEEFISNYMGEAPNPVMDKEFDYTATDGKKKKITVRGALRLPKEHPAHIQATKIVGPDDAPVNEPKKKEQPPQAGQPVQKGQTAQGKINNTPNDQATDQANQNIPNPQTLSGVELKSKAEKSIEKQKSGKTKEGFTKRIGEKIKNWSEEEKQFFVNKVHHGDSPERRTWSKAIMDKTKGAGVAIMHGLKHEAQLFKTAGQSIGKLMHGKKLDDSEKEGLKSVGKKIAVAAIIGLAGGGLAHGAAAFAKHLAMEFIPHTLAEVIATGVGKAAVFAEGVDDTESNLKIFAAAMAERMQNATIPPEIIEKAIDSYNMSKLKDKLNEGISESKTQSIQHFVEFATKRLKLKETPKVALIGGREFANTKSSLGGYNPESKEIFVSTEGRLTADILRTLAHEMVHRKQDEMGLVRNVESDGKDGSPIENQAHAVAGILMREYGRINKQIYNEDVNVDVDKGDEILTGKFKNKKTIVKNIGTDDHGMPTINGRQATTFRTTDEVGSNDWHFKAIMKMWDNAGSFGKKKIGVVVCNNPKASRDDVARKLRGYGYGEVTHVTDKLGLDENNSLNDLQKQRMVLYTKAFKMMPNSPAQLKVRADIDRLSKEIERLEKKNINESTPSEIIKDLDKVRNDLIKKVDVLIAKKKKLYSNVDIESPMSTDEKKLNKDIAELFSQIQQLILQKRSLKEGLLTEGGAYGHMSHPFDDMNLTFGDLKNIIKGALTGNLELTREKTDGQALAISWKNGRLIAARNKSHLQNAGAGAMGIEDVASKFGGRGGLTDAYNFAMKDLSAAVQSLSEAQRKKIFNEGKCFMNLEVIWPTSVNVIPYGQALLVFHNTTCYDEKGSAIGANQGAATMLAGMIKQVNADVQSKYTIQGPPVTELPKKEELSSKQTKYLTQLQKIQFQFQLSDKDGVSEYHQAWWEDFVNKSKVKLQKLEKEALVRRWAFGDKSFRLNTIADKDAQGWAIENDKVNVTKQQKDNVRQFEEIFLGVGADVLSFMGSVLTVNPDMAIRNMKDRLKDTAAKVRGSGDISKIQKLKSELARLQSIGGKNKIVPNEGIVFVYKGSTYKLTGTFAPLNQILGIFYE
jgi:hypothetical protein